MRFGHSRNSLVAANEDAFTIMREITKSAQREANMEVIKRSSKSFTLNNSTRLEYMQSDERIGEEESSSTDSANSEGNWIYQIGQRDETEGDYLKRTKHFCA